MYLGNDDEEAECDDAGVPHVDHLEVGSFDRGGRGGGEQGCQHQLGGQRHHDAVREVIQL